MKKVSVIVPVYNTEQYLKKCIESLLNQTLEEIEIVIVNDGSTDHSKQILEEYANNYKDKVKLFSKENGGQASVNASFVAIRFSNTFFGTIPLSSASITSAASRRLSPFCNSFFSSSRSAPYRLISFLTVAVSS